MLKNVVFNYHELANPSLSNGHWCIIGCWLGLLIWHVTFEAEVIAPTGRPAPLFPPSDTRGHTGVCVCSARSCLRTSERINPSSVLVLFQRALSGELVKTVKLRWFGDALLWRENNDEIAPD